VLKIFHSQGLLAAMTASETVQFYKTSKVENLFRSSQLSAGAAYTPSSLKTTSESVIGMFDFYNQILVQRNPSNTKEAILTISTFSLRAEKEAETENAYDITLIRYLIFAGAICFVAVWQYRKYAANEGHIRPQNDREEPRTSAKGGKLASKTKGMAGMADEQMQQMQDLMRQMEEMKEQTSNLGKLGGLDQLKEQVEAMGRAAGTMGSRAAQANRGPNKKRNMMIPSDEEEDE